MDYCSRETPSCSICRENFDSMPLLVAHVFKIHGSKDEAIPSYLLLQDYMKRCYLNLFQQNVLIAKSGSFETHGHSQMMDKPKSVILRKAEMIADNVKYISDLEDLKNEPQDSTDEEFGDDGIMNKQNEKYLSDTEETSRLKPTMNTGGKFPCRLCHRIFTNLRALKSHNRDHMISAPYLCNVCSFSTDERGNLVRHMKQHNGLRPYQCAICRYLFTTKANCERHLKNRHRLRSRHALLATVIHLDDEEENKQKFSKTFEIIPSSSEELIEGDSSRRDETRRYDEATAPNCLLCKTRLCNHSQYFKLENDHQDAPDSLVDNKLAHLNTFLEAVKRQKPEDINSLHASNCSSNDPYSLAHLNRNTPYSNSSDFNDTPLDLRIHERPVNHSQKEIVDHPSNRNMLTKPKTTSISPESSNYLGMNSSDWRMLVELSNHSKYIAELQEHPTEGTKNSSYRKKLPLPRKCTNVRKAKPKQRRYRTEKPFCCRFCSGRFTLSTNLERHIKNHHPENWQRRNKK